MGLIGFFKNLFRRKPSKPPSIPPVEKEPEFRKPQVTPEVPRIEVPRRLSVTIGLDFGTAATKCVINLEGADSGKDRFLAIIGGLHLEGKEGQYIENTLEELKKYKIKSIYPAHCTGLENYYRLKKLFGNKCHYGYTGKVIIPIKSSPYFSL